MTTTQGEWQPRFGDWIGEWYRHFAWLPVRTFDGRFAWLRTVDRRRVQKHDYLHGRGADFWFMHRAVPTPPSPDTKGGEA